MLIPYYSFSTKGYLKDPNDDFFINLHKIGAFLCKKNYGEVHLITDTKGRDFFKKKVNFDSITVLKELDNIPESYRQVWSLGKILCYKHLAREKIPFLHVDYDVFLWKKLPDFIENADVFAQNLERNAVDHYKVDSAFKYCKYKNFPIKKNFLQKLLNIKNKIYPDFAYNMGIFGGQDFSFIEDYASKSLEFVFHPDNDYFWKEFKVQNPYGLEIYWSKATIAEQWYLAKCEELFDKKITCLFNEKEANSGMWSEIDFHNNEYDLLNDKSKKKILLNKLLSNKDIYLNAEDICYKYGYTHLWGAKSSSPVQAMVNDLAKKLGL